MFSFNLQLQLKIIRMHNSWESQSCDKKLQYLLSVFDSFFFDILLFLKRFLYISPRNSDKLIMFKAEKSLKRNSKQTKPSCTPVCTHWRPTESERVLMKGDVVKQ